MSTAASVATAAVFGTATATGIIVLEMLAIRSPGSAAERLDRIRTYVETHRDAVINVVLLGGGVWLAGRGLLGLTR